MDSHDEKSKVEFKMEMEIKKDKDLLADGDEYAADADDDSAFVDTGTSTARSNTCSGNTSIISMTNQNYQYNCPSGYPITYINRSQDLNIILNSTPRLVITYFFATWCAPCNMCSKKFNKMAQDFSRHVTFLKIDTDNHQDLLRKYNVRAMPTFKLFRESRETGCVVGAHLNQVAGLIRDNLVCKLDLDKKKNKSFVF